MTIKKSDGIPVIYHGRGYVSTFPKYPSIESGDKGIMTPAHKFEVEKRPSRPFNFYPAKWGYIYYIPVSQADYKTIQL